MREIMKKINIVILLTVGLLISSPINEVQSLKVAKNIYKQFSPTKNIDNFNVDRLETIKTDDGVSLVYIYHLEPEGFILVSGTDKSIPCLAYGFDSNFKTENMPSNLLNVMNTYKEEIENHLDSQVPQKTEIKQLWNLYLSNENTYPETRNVSPLIDAEFDQSGGWNNYLTSQTGFNGPVGCVAVAMSQLMHYWGHPYTGEGSNGYLEDNYGFLEVDFSQSYYDFDNMAATYPSNASQILLYDTGISVNMDYANSGSGAWVMGGYPSSEYALEFYFKYDSDMYHMYKSDNNATIFSDAIKENLDNSLPVIMVGYGDDYGGGHAWNIDGYTGNNFHCNWGWGGWSNGYFNLTTMGGFPDGQSVLLNVYPRDLEAPTALYDYYVDASTVYFFDLSSEVNTEELRNWHWNFGDGSTAITTNGEISHTFTLTGSYDVELIVENIYGMMSEPFIESIDVIAASQGDLNLDGTLDVLDVVTMVNFVLGGTPSESDLFIGDMNADEILNIQDIILLIYAIINP